MEITIKWAVDSTSYEEAKKKVMALLKNTQGTLLPLLPDWDPEEQHNADPEGQMQNEIQDLKLENDRLKQREEKMLRVIRSIACDYGACEKCLFFGSDNLPCGDAGDYYKVCVTVLEELEDL